MEVIDAALVNGDDLGHRIGATESRAGFLEVVKWATHDGFIV